MRFAPGRYRLIQKPIEHVCPSCGDEGWGKPRPDFSPPDIVTITGPAENFHCGSCLEPLNNEGWYTTTVLAPDGGYYAVPFTRLAPIESRP